MCVWGGGGGVGGRMVRYSTQTCVVTLPSFCFLKAIVCYPHVLYMHFQVPELLLLVRLLFGELECQFQLHLLLTQVSRPGLFHRLNQFTSPASDSAHQ